MRAAAAREALYSFELLRSVTVADVCISHVATDRNMEDGKLVSWKKTIIVIIIITILLRM